jgi:fatty-acyl-CoA synthase
MTMKIAFSTLACPEMDWADITSMAKDVGFDGIEVRGLGREILAYHAAPFTEGKLAETVKKLSAMRLAIPCFSTDCCLKYPEKSGANYNEITSYIALAQKTGTPYVRLLADLSGYPDGEVDDAFVISELKKLAPVAAAHGVTLLVETNGVYADTARLRRLLEQVADDAVAALWDMQHPYRVFGEAPETTIQNLGAYIKHIHAKDSVMQDGRPSYRMMGEGDLPIADMMLALRSINYEGYVSLEWLKRWAPDLTDGAVVIPQFAWYMGRFTEKVKVQGQLFDNNAKTGKYIWEKESLIDLTFPQLLDRIVEEFPDQWAFR